MDGSRLILFSKTLQIYLLEGHLFSKRVKMMGDAWIGIIYLKTNLLPCSHSPQV